LLLNGHAIVASDFRLAADHIRLGIHWLASFATNDKAQPRKQQLDEYETHASEDLMS
jgi:hypothetical protein